MCRYERAVTEDSDRSGLREGINAAGEELGRGIAADLPSTPADVRSRLPDDPEELMDEGAGISGPSLRSALAGSPLDRYLDGGGTSPSADSDDG